MISMHCLVNSNTVMPRGPNCKVLYEEHKRDIKPQREKTE